MTRWGEMVRTIHASHRLCRDWAERNIAEIAHWMTELEILEKRGCLRPIDMIKKDEVRERVLRDKEVVLALKEFFDAIDSDWMKGAEAKRRIYRLGCRAANLADHDAFVRMRKGGEA